MGVTVAIVGLVIYGAVDRWLNDTPRVPSSAQWQRDGIAVRVHSAEVDRDTLHITVHAANTGSAPVYYSGWRYATSDGVLVTESTGARYGQESIHQPTEGPVLLQMRALGVGPPGNVEPNLFRFEIFRFRVPSARAEYIDLDLPAKAIGQGGFVRFPIPASAWRGPKAKK